MDAWLAWGKQRRKGSRGPLFLLTKRQDQAAVSQAEEFSKKRRLGPSLVVQQLSVCAPTAGGAGLIPGQATKTLPAAQLCCAWSLGRV